MKASIVLVGNRSNWLESVRSHVEASKHFMNVVCFHSGTAALEYIEEQKPHVVFTELSIPDTDGLQIIRQIHQDKQYNPFIYVATCMNSDSIMITLSKLGVDYISVKPVKPELISHNLELFLENVEILDDQPAQLKLVISPDNKSQNNGWTDSINEFLERLGARASLRSTHCTMESIKYQLSCNEKDQYISAMNIYHHVASVISKGSTPGSVERNVRTTLKDITTNTNEFYRQVFGDVRLSSRNFILYSSRFLSKSMKEDCNVNQYFDRIVRIG